MTSAGCCKDQPTAHSGLACAGVTHCRVSNRSNISNEQHGGEPAAVETLLAAEVLQQSSVFCETRQFVALLTTASDSRLYIEPNDTILSLLTPILSPMTHNSMPIDTSPEPNDT